MDSFKVLNNKQIAWLNVTGSGNETSAHVQQSPRMTIMFCAFEGTPLILRLYGTAKVVHNSDPEWDHLLSLFPPPAWYQTNFRRYPGSCPNLLWNVCSELHL